MSLYVIPHNIQIHTYQLIHSTVYLHLVYLISIRKYQIVCFSAEHTNSYLPIDAWHIISLSGKRVFNIAGIRVSEISVYYENRRVVPM